MLDHKNKEIIFLKTSPWLLVQGGCCGGADYGNSGSQSEESNALDLPSAYDVRDYVLQRPSQEANSEAFSSE
ncbi:shieldin complex subunit 1-like [Tursiops truncatus]|uniref:shieldin complex subunit 1-like n=1 Tax=Tursiops truncatus TaxID=9739 RepID=UPI003CCF9B0D